MSGLSISVPVDVDTTVTVDPDHGHIFGAVFRIGDSDVTLTGSWRELHDLAGSMLGQLNAQEPDDLKLGTYVRELSAKARAERVMVDWSTARAVSEPDPPSLESRRDFGGGDEEAAKRAQDFRRETQAWAEAQRARLFGPDPQDAA